MAALSALAANFAENERPAGNLLDDAGVLAQAVAAAKFYAGYGRLSVHQALIDAAKAAAVLAGTDPLVAAAAVTIPEIAGDTEISVSEWAVIRPLFLLYVERETAIQLEATRGMGLDVFGRSTSEIAGEIQQAEMDIPHKAFVQQIVTI